MKKAKRLLSILLALTMLLGTVSVFASAASHPYKDSNITYNDVDKPVFTTEQYASMGLDEVDRMLSEENLVLDVYVLTLDLTSVDNALHSLGTALTSVSSLLPLLGDAQLLSDKAFWFDNSNTVSRTNTTDINIVYTLLKFLSDNTTLEGGGDGVIALYAKGTIGLGVLNSLVSDYIFNLRELAICMLYSLMDGDSDYDYFDDGTAGVPGTYLADGGFDILVQDLLNYFVLGEWVKMDDYFALPLTDGNHRDFEDYFDGVQDANKDYYAWFHREGWVTYALGGKAVVNAGAAAPAADLGVVNINSAETGYVFIENLIQTAYNELAVPVLNRETRPWLREMCGVTYLREKMDPRNEAYVPDYDGEPYADGDLDPALAALFDVDGMYVPEANLSGNITVYGALDANDNVVYGSARQLQYNYTTFISAFNTTLGQFLDAIILAPQSAETWTWYYGTGADGDNAYLFKNICEVARYVLGVTGDSFFAAYIDVKEAGEYASMTDQQVVSFVLRAILNASVDWMYIPDDVQTVAEVGFEACAQLAAQDIPQFDYAKPVKGSLTEAAYNQELVSACLDILLDVAVYNLNQGMDMVPADGADPVNQAGLLQYTHDYEPLVLQVVAWALDTYGSVVDLGFHCDDAEGATTGLTINDAWADIDTLVNAIIPIKGTGAWIYDEIASQPYVVKGLIFDNIVAPLTNLDPTDLESIFKKNDAGAFAQDSVKEIAIGLVERILELIFPNLITTPITSFDDVLDTDTIASIVKNLIGTLYSRREALIAVVLPIVCDVIGLSAQQEFKEMEVYMPGLINATDAQANGLTFKVYNGSQGLNTAYTDVYGNFEQDSLYKYTISSATVLPTGCGISATGLAGATINGGEGVNVSLTGDFDGNLNSVVELAITYNVYGEDGTTPLTSAPLTTSSYAYISNAAKGDDEVVIEETMANGYTVGHSSDMYLNTGDDLTDIEGYSVMFKADDDHATISLSSAAVSSAPTTAVPAGATIAPANLIGNSAERNSVADTKAGGMYYLFPYSVATYTDTTVTPSEVKKYDIYKDWEKVTVDPETQEETITTEDNNGISHGKYVTNATFVASGESKTISTTVHLYNEYGLAGAYNAAVGKNRQASSYDTEADSGIAATYFTNYKTALRNAAKLVLAPKEGTTFEADIAATNSAYANLYEQYATELENAITALDAYELSAGVEGLKTAIGVYSPVNYIAETNAANEPIKTDLKYYEDGYSFFGMRDFVPHTYSNYKSARNHAQSLVDSQELYAPIAPEPLPANATQYEYGKYLEACTAYEVAHEKYLEDVANIGTLGTVDAVYAQHMVTLMGSRLISLQADKSKLAEAYALYNMTNGTAADIAADPTNFYTTESWENYVHACQFAQATLALDTSATNANGTYVLKPSRVNTAISELVESWKKLVEGADVTALQSAIGRANQTLDDPTAETTYTAESLAVLETARTDAQAIIAAHLAVSDANEARILAAITAIDDAITGLVVAEVPVVEPEWSLTLDVVGYDDTGADTTPFIDADRDSEYRSSYSALTETEGFLYGMGVYFDGSVVEGAINVSNATVVAQETDFGGGTGTSATVYDLDNNPVYTYYIVVIGDLNGDSIAGEATDLEYISSINAGSLEYPDPYGPANGSAAAMLCAADINDDWGVDGSDYDQLTYVSAGMAYIDQMQRTLSTL